jgi:hypothetical protein
MEVVWWLHGGTKGSPWCAPPAKGSVFRRATASAPSPLSGAPPPAATQRPPSKLCPAIAGDRLRPHKRPPGPGGPDRDN